MNIETVSLSTLAPSRANPRKSIEAHGIEGLAASIRTDGLLQNLVVQPENGSERYSIISGERRYRALLLLRQRGELPDDFAVPVEIRKGLSKDDTMRIATVENLQRANLAPLEEAAALTKLVHKGVTLEDVSAQTGLSPTTIKRRLVLNGLCKEAKVSLRKGGITLAQAEALTLGNHDAQRGILEELGRGYHDFSPSDIRESFLDERPTVALAIFPLEQYTGTITTDLFAEDETSYFDDAEQFMALQQVAVAQLVLHHEASAPWVERMESRRIPEWQFRTAKKRENGGVIINLAPNGRVDILEGVMRREIDSDTAEQTAENPLAPTKHTASYAAPLRRYVAHHKSMAVQELLLANPRKAREVAAIKGVMTLEPHECLRALAQADNPQGAYTVLDTQARLTAAKLGITIEDDEPAWRQLSYQYGDVALYDAVKALSDHELDELHVLLAALAFGQRDCSELDTGDSLFNRVAQDLGADMTNHWRPDRAFIERRKRQQLTVMAGECGYGDGRSLISGYKKSELVAGLLRHFGEAMGAATPSTAQEKARAWLPEVMRFPAIDLDASE